MSAVTVVVPTKDRRGLLAHTLRSVLGQEQVDVRVVVVDDGSADDTATWAAAMDDRVEVVRHDASRGAASSRNAGIARVETEWVAFCDDDDLWAPSKLRRQLDALAAMPEAAWCCTGAVAVGPDLEIVADQRLGRSGDVLPLLLVSNDIPGGGSSVLARTERVRAAGGFAEDLPASEDWELWIRLAARSPLAVVDEPLVAYRVWPGGKSRHVARMEAAFDAITSRHAPLAERCRVSPDRRAHQRFLAKQALGAGDRIGAARRFLGAGMADRAALALVAPRLLDRVGTARMRAAVDPTWRGVAEDWLGPLRPAEQVGA